MQTTFGTRLRAQRERQQIELGAISERTKIKQSLLEALERDDLSQWPKGVFRRAYVKAYAQAIGLNPDTVVRDFLAIYPDPEETAEEQLARAAERKGRPPTRMHFLLGSALSGILGSRTDAPPPEAPPERPQGATALADTSSFLREHELVALADVCGRTARAQSDELPTVLRDAARLLNAASLSVWVWDPAITALRATLTYGYSREVLMRLPIVPAEADNALAAAYRSRERCVVYGSSVATGAVVVPLVTAGGCTGVFAVEFRDGGEHRECERAIISILAAQLSLLSLMERSAVSPAV